MGNWFLVRILVETPGETSPGETSSESSTSQLITSGSCASTEGTSDEYCRRDLEAAASATFQTGNTKRHKDCKRTFNKDWELDYLVTYESNSDTCICLKCNSTFDTVKSICYNDTMKKCIQKQLYGIKKRENFLLSEKSERQQMKNSLSGVCVINYLNLLRSS